MSAELLEGVERHLAELRERLAARGFAGRVGFGARRPSWWST